VRIAALVPVKRLDAAKSRLRPLAGEAGADLARAMLEDVLEAVAGVDSIAEAAVVTGDPEVARVARAAGATALVEPDEGLNPSLDAAARRLGADALLVVLGDVAGARAEDLAALVGALDALGGRGVVLAPSSDGGSAALLRAPHDIIPSAFGPDSAARHRAAARAAGVPFRELKLPSLAVDLDCPEDVAAFLAGASASRGGRRTRALLERLAGATARERP
jgi:2-phospho-L-lactate guanylyltransferase